MANAPFPSKDEIAEFVRSAEGKVGKREISRAFKLDVEQKRTLKRVLKEMKDDGMLSKGRGHRVSEPGSLPPVGIIEITGTDLDGEVMARPVKWEEDGPPPKIFVAPDGTGPALGRGEKVLARLNKQADAYEAKVIRRIAEAPRDVLGIVIEADGERRIQPVDKRDRFEYVIERGADKGAELGDLVRAEPVKGHRLGLKHARIIERIEDAEGVSAISLISVHQHGIPVTFTPDAMRQAERAKEATLDGRDDLRSIPLVTIDGADARDFDDAVFAEPDDDPKNPGGYKLIVAIADVAWYVRTGDALDKAAFERGNSVYFPDRVVPMLPEQLSNGWCSLRPNEDRPCLIVHLRIDNKGNLLSKRFKRALMRSVARLTYEQVQTAQDGTPDEQTQPLMDTVIKPLYGAFEILERAREARGALELDLPERRVILDEDGHMVGIEPRQRLDSHKLIEEFMVLANVAAAEYLEEKKRPCMYRVHDEPSMSKVEALSEVLDSVHISFDKGQTLTPARYNAILARAKDTPHQQMINDVVLRSQAQALYQPDNLGHFGLALRRYCHFTSPIRRYADLLVHRALIRGLSPSAGELPADPGDFNSMGEHLSITERRAQAAERGAMDRYCAYYMKDRVGSTFGARISGVTRFGLFISVDDTGADGLIPIKTLPDDYYIHDEGKHLLTGRKRGLTFRLGQRIEVLLREVTPITGGMLFELLGKAEPLGKGAVKPDTDGAAPISRTGRKSRKKQSGNPTPKKPKGKSRASRRRQRTAGAAPKPAKGKKKRG